MTELKEATQKLIDSTQADSDIRQLFQRIAELQPEQQVLVIQNLIPKMGNKLFYSRELSEWILNNRPLIAAELGPIPKSEPQPDYFNALDEAMIDLNDAAQFINDDILQSAIWTLEEVIRNLKQGNRHADTN